MKTRNKIFTKGLYIKKFLSRTFNDNVELLKIDKNKIYIKTSSGIDKTVVLGIKILKCYSLLELYEMQLLFFQSLRPNIIYDIGKEETHIYYRKTKPLKTVQADTKGQLNCYETVKYDEIYNYIQSVITVSLTNNFELEYFPPNSYKYIVHTNDKAYLVELSSEVFG